MLQAIAAQIPEQADALLLQLANAHVVVRENTGAGFYTTFKVTSGSRLESLKSPVGDVGALVGGLAHGLGFLLWLRDGFMHKLEGYSYEENTSEIDFLRVGFGPVGPRSQIVAKAAALMTQELKIGDRVRLSGGYDQGSDWLGGLASISGVVTAFVPAGEAPAAVVNLDEPFVSESVTGDWVVMQLRWVGSRWVDEGVVHVQLCDVEPERKAWAEGQHGRWVESHASYAKL